jgi:hypothetical protein
MNSLPTISEVQIEVALEDPIEVEEEASEEEEVLSADPIVVDEEASEDPT